MSSDEDDYMSDKFLQGAEKYVTPSLIHRYSDKIDMKILKKKDQIKAKLKGLKAIKIMEEEKREEGLSSAISSDNKGFAMLAKMGYKPGQGIGKNESGISEPISLNVKTNRLGFGKGKVRKNSTKSNKSDEKFNASDFRNRLSQKKDERLVQADLCKSQKICEQLDMQNNIDKPIETWFWSPIEIEKDKDESSAEEKKDEEENDNEDLLSSIEKLEMIIKYLREKYFYCIWCAVKFENEDDLQDNCSGRTRNDH